MQANREQIDLLRDLSMKHFWVFAQSLIEDRYYDENFHTEVCNYLQRATLDDGFENILLVLPRSFLKSTLVGLFTLWQVTRERVLRDDDLRVLIVSNTETNATKKIAELKRFITSPFYRSVFFDMIGEDVYKQSSLEFSMNRKQKYPEHTFTARGLGAKLAGTHYNIIVQDDTVEAKKDDLGQEDILPSPEEVMKAVNFNKTLVPPLFTGVGIQQNIFVGTRWADYDAINWIYEFNKKIEANSEVSDAFKRKSMYAIMDKPAIDESGQSVYKNFDLEKLEVKREQCGNFMFSMHYLNKPMSPDSLLIRRNWVKYDEITNEDRKDPQGFVRITVDPSDAATGKKSQCYNGLVVALHSKSGVKIIEGYRFKYAEGEIAKKILDKADRLATVYERRVEILVEGDKYAYLSVPLRDEMRRRGKHYRVETPKTRGKSKEDRVLLSLGPMIQNGAVTFVRGMRDLETEMFSFPHGQLKDIVDALAWQVYDYAGRRIERTVEVEKKKPNTFSFDELMGMRVIKPGGDSVLAYPALDGRKRKF